MRICVTFLKAFRHQKFMTHAVKTAIWFGVAQIHGLLRVVFTHC